ncbi:uncharacterized protein QC761_0028450 [Podospora bellae-mahoneyi]|uniref:NodB homology domain-containing protein n=1 Tax=Podospora bellae-mahoneyi TaxID=2093777 RepID=A0ABR0FVJ0_9PEZI|nr:hypothetical protein QC761_0028450 [Podospora bellae-mahoneyi]
MAPLLIQSKSKTNLTTPWQISAAGTGLPAVSPRPAVLGLAIVDIPPLTASHIASDNLRRVRRDHFRPKNRGRRVYDCTQRNTITLTFDDGPSAQTGPLLDLLHQEGFRATFFVNGEHGTSPSILRRGIDQVHQLASHTWGHLENLDLESSESMNQQVMWNKIMYRDILGFFPTYMRSSHSKCDGACLAQMGGLGYIVVMWNLDTEDWKNHPASNI